MQYPGSLLYNTIKFNGDETRPSLPVTAPYSGQKPSDLFDMFKDDQDRLRALHAQRSENEKDLDSDPLVSSSFLTEVGRKVDSIFDPVVIRSSSLRPEVSQKTIHEILGNRYNEFFFDVPKLVQFLSSLHADHGYTSIDIRDKRLNPDSVEIVLEHMRILRLSRLGIVEDPKPLNPEDFEDAIKVALSDTMKEFRIRRDWY